MSTCLEKINNFIYSYLNQKKIFYRPIIQKKINYLTIHKTVQLFDNTPQLV